MKKIFFFLIASLTFLSCNKDLIESNAQEINDLKIKVAVLESQISGLQTEVSNLKTTNQQIQVQLNNSLELIGTNEEEIESLNLSLVAANNTISALQELIDLNQDEIKSLNLSLETANNTLANLQELISANQSGIESINLGLSSANSSILNLQELISTNQSGIESINLDLIAATKTITSLQAVLVSLQSFTGNNADSIESLNKKIIEINLELVSQINILSNSSEVNTQNILNILNELNLKINELQEIFLDTKIFISDDNFESALIQLGYDDVLDNFVLRKNIINIKSLNVENKGIISLAGIESFSSLETLIVSYNNLSFINISQNTKLKHIDLLNNKISSIDVSKNTNLEILVLNGNNSLNSLSVINNTNLKELSIFGTKVSSLDLLNNVLLTDLDIGSTQITNIDLKSNTNLNRFLGYSPKLDCVELDETILNLFPPSCQNNDPSTCFTSKNFNFSSNVNFKSNCSISEFSTDTFIDDSYFIFKEKYSVEDSLNFAGQTLYINSIADVVGSDAEWKAFMKGQYGLNQSISYVRVSTSKTSQANAPHMEIFYNSVNGDLLMIRFGYWLSQTNTIDSCTSFKHFVYKRYYPNRLNEIDFNDNCQANSFENMNLMKNAVESYFQLLNPIYLDENGVTIKAYDWAEIGDKGIINGVEYTIVDEVTLRQMIANEQDVTKVVTSKISNFENLFFNKTLFNQNIVSWDTSNVTNMNRLFAESAFNQPIGSWDVSSVITMFDTFFGTPFNQDLSNWDVSNVRLMQGTFAYSSFNQDISNWDVSNVSRMYFMFWESEFNKPLNVWDVSNVTNMEGMFIGASFFNQDISDWDVSNVTNMRVMFQQASSFNQDIGDWDVSKVTNMNSMFYRASTFNQDLSSWCVTNIASSPPDFDRDTPVWTLPKPVWGTCPD